jgi:hypothetical protein
MSISTVRTMTRLIHTLVLFSMLYGHFWGPVAARDTSLRAKRLEVAKHWESSVRSRNSANNVRRATDTSAPPRVKNITFSNPKASGAYAWVHVLPLPSSHALPEFWVNGATIPEVNFDVGPSWSGLIPISNGVNETRKVRLLRHRQLRPGLTHHSVVLLALSSGSGRNSR